MCLIKVHLKCFKTPSLQSPSRSDAIEHFTLKFGNDTIHRCQRRSITPKSWTTHTATEEPAHSRNPEENHLASELMVFLCIFVYNQVKLSVCTCTCLYKKHLYLHPRASLCTCVCVSVCGRMYRRMSYSVLCVRKHSTG